MKWILNSATTRKTSGSGTPGWQFASVIALFLLVAGGALATTPAPENSQTDYDYSKQTMRVGVWLDKSDDDIYRRGENQTVGFQTNSDGYAVVYRIDTEGLVTILWPRSRMNDGFVFGAHEYALPVSGAARIKVSGDEGLGYVEAIVSSYPFDLRDLEIDFHHEARTEDFDFYVAGDPFLAMNEINFAITGLEDSADYVVTNYASYYVHEKVDHPRYLCNQCHVDESVAYDPYDDHCTLEINYDFGWSNSWYGTYGYYPVYWHPAYVYIDPWTWRPWVNYWYYPSYRCPPLYGYRWGYSAYAWYDSPYYWGDSYTYWDSGHRRYRPLGHVYDGGTLRKTREYGGVSSLVQSRLLDDNQRNAMKTRTPLEYKSVRGVVAAKDGLRDVSRSGFKGERPVVRSRPDLSNSDQAKRGLAGSRPGLRVRENVRDGSNVRPTVRHTAGGSKTRPSLEPVSGKAPSVRGNVGIHGERPVPQRSGDLKDSSGRGQGTIKPVEPRKKGTRVWNRGSYQSTGERTRDGAGSRSSDPARSSGKTVKPKPSKRGDSSSKVDSESRKSNSSSSGSDSRGSSPKVRESKGSGSSGGTSGGGTKSRSSGGSSSSSGSGSKRSGGDSRRK